MAHPDGDGGMRLALVAIGDPNNRFVWSGTPHHALREMQRRLGSVAILNTGRLDRALRLVNRYTRKLGWDLGRESLVARLYARTLEREIARLKPDAVLSVGASNKLAYADIDVPIVHVSDALFETITTYYDRYAGLFERSRSLGNRLQQSLISRAGSIVLTSEWAKREAEQFYDVRPGLIKVAPIGANLDSDPGSSVVDSEKDRLRLLFVGFDWQRKGGPLLLDIFEHVRSAIPDATLQIVGCEPAAARGRANVEVIGVLRKTDAGERARLENLYRDAAMFVMPSLEEAFGLVYCEAAAYGLPVIALETGGVPTIVRNGESGLLFEPGTDAAVIAARIVAFWNDRPRYEAMRRAARGEFETRLNWAAWGDAIEAELRALVAGRGASAEIDQRP